MTIPRKKYIEAMELLEREGWGQGLCVREPCVAVAIGRTTGIPGYTLLPPGAVAFNDDPETTYEDVLTLLALGAAGAFE